MEPGYEKGDSSNLPMVDILMVGNYFATNSNFCAAEFRHVKTSISSRESYGDDAVGYVQIKREAGLCITKCRICPEHKVRSKPYSVTVVVNESDNIIQSAQCHDCAASYGGCKHAVAFVMWLHRRSEEPSCTEVSCYWQKSKLSKVGTMLKFISASELTKEEPNVLSDPGVLEKFIEEGTKRKLSDCELIKYQLNYSGGNEIEDISLHQLVLKHGKKSSSDFLETIRPLFTDTMLKKIENNTRNQNKSNLWHELRYGRITASKAYEVSKCKTSNGSLIAMIMGGKVAETAAMKRGQILEDEVLKIVEKKIGKKITKCGLFISKAEPMIAGSPDGISGNEFIIEIKCPINENTIRNYIKDSKISNKCMAQIQIQMYVTGITKCCFCVAHYDFKKNNDIKIISVNYDPQYVVDLVNELTSFWKSHIYPFLQRTLN